jgi:hypothetical protein
VTISPWDQPVSVEPVRFVCVVRRAPDKKHSLDKGG